MELLDIDLAIRAFSGDDEEAEPINVALEVPIVMLIGFHHLYCSWSPLPMTMPGTLNCVAENGQTSLACEPI
jgi:hypothetical protein